MALLDKDTFSTVIESTPLVSIDLVVENEHGHFLLGVRTNKPAKGFWFVPGGRILKNESMSDAFKRLTMQELGKKLSIDNAECLGPFEHFYSDCVFGDNVSTHYVVLGYRVCVQESELSLPLVQHNDYQWFSGSEVLVHPDVHIHSKWYFQKSS